MSDTNDVSGAFGAGIFVTLLVVVPLWLVTQYATQEQLDDDVCQPDEVRAEIAVNEWPDENTTKVRCISLSDYRDLDGQGRLVHDGAQR